MADTTKTFTLLTELEGIDVHEDRILDELLRRGAALEEAERRSRMVTVAELHALRSGLQTLETAINALQEGVARAEAAADEPAAKPANGNGGSKGYGSAPAAPAAAAPVAPAAAAPVAPGTPAAPVAHGAEPAAVHPPADPVPVSPPPPPPTFDALAALVREHDAEGCRLRELLRERFASLEPDPVAVADSAGSAGPVAVPTPGDGPGAIPVAAPTLRLTKPAMRGTEVVALQMACKHRFERWEIGLHVDTNGAYDVATRHAVRRVARGLGIAPEELADGITPAVQSLIRNPSGRTAEQLERAVANRAWLRALRKRYPAGGHSHGHSHGPSHTHDTAPPKPRPRPRPAGGLEAAIRAHGGRYEDVIVRAARARGVPVSLVCAVVEHESGFRNVFGHDRVANPIKSPPGGLLEVTEERYRTYRGHRDRGLGAQGVGPMQLTWPAFQDRADKAGGCWKVEPNIKVGVGVLADNIRAHGTRVGVARYNGSGLAAQAYADGVLKRERVWRTRLAGASAGGGGGSHAPKPKQKPHEPRVYKVTAKPMSGSDIKAFQGDLNDRMERWGVDLRIEEDGVYGATTAKTARRVLRGLGIAPTAYARGVTPELRGMIRNPGRRTPQQLALARRNRAWLKALRKRYAIAGGRSGSGGRKGGRYPLGKRGKLIGRPYQGTHSIGNWQSDNAVDISIPVGTQMIAIDDGVVTKVSRHAQDGSRFAGDAITIKGERGNAYFYKHGVASVSVGQTVRRGQVIGTSGSANGSPHLHLGIMKGNPVQIIGER